eukprot:CAMPEP_0172923520 /NCGR_PEP_ID=MMETSP1075-20121228/209893_1 /TAXON_ID=2916 /ORGANISM="Ceratium fusus, Strain PA161109" /LENGTH=44 /DNA_ID= /DNA_START= /DNA_END= /DNA_ORIENTATION=
MANPATKVYILQAIVQVDTCSDADKILGSQGEESFKKALTQLMP